MELRGDDWAAFIARRYGRKMGLVRHYGYLARYLLGSFSSLKRVEWNSVTRLVFVCKGNICRSPYAEARARAMGLPCSSFGLEAGEHKPANPSAIRAAWARGLDLSGHRTQGASEFTIAAGDLLTAMEPWHVEVLQSRPMPVDAQVTLLGLWCSPSQPHIEDPLGLSDEYFQTCFGTIDKAIESMSALRCKAETNPQPR
jgi:low molecular weight protein-tyrosine phosphatase